MVIFIKKNADIDSEKVFLYFTSQSYSHFGMQWGFHVATVIRIQGEPYVVEKIPDIEVTSAWYNLKDNLMYSNAVPLSAWLEKLTGFKECRSLDMNHPEDEADFRYFNSIRAAWGAPYPCVMSIVPSEYWWPGSVYSSVNTGTRLSSTGVPYTQAMSACRAVLDINNNKARSEACTKLLK